MTDQPPSAPPHTAGRPVRRRGRQTLSSLQIVFALILSIGLLLVINFSGRIARGQQMEAERRRLQATIDVLEFHREELLRERNYASNDVSIEDWAHREGKMVREGEILIIPIPGGLVEPTPTPTPQALIVAPPTPKPEQASWNLWWNLFFDGPAPF